MLRRTAVAGIVLAAFAPVADAWDDTPHYDDAFNDAVAVWHMRDLTDAAGKSDLKLMGAVTPGQRLSGREEAESKADGSDGVVGQFDGGYLDAGQGADGRLNLTGSALTVALRLRNPSGTWGSPIFNKYGGHEHLVYNLYASPSAIGFELGTRDNPDLTGLQAPFANIGAKEWHTVICCYDGKSLKMFIDGVLMDEADVTGPLRTGNTEPVLIGAESNGGQVKTGFRGQIDYAALWSRALTGPEIVRLSGGARRVAANTKQYKEMHLLPPQPDLYHEKYRPQFHFTARQWTVHSFNPGQREEGWLNDVNGLIYLDGTWHLFAQRWARCWIHAVSTDLIHWTELQPAFWDDHRFGTGVQSGGCVYDVDNTSGLAHDKKHPALIAFWSGFDNLSQCLSYSLDKGQTWTKYEHNPTFLHPERDPKVFWYEPTKTWIMVMSDNGSYDFLKSSDLLHWTQLPHSIPDSYECPDFFPLPVDGDMNHQKWVLIRGNGKYSVGAFDGTQFTEETKQFDCDHGPNFYATMSWGDVTGAPGRRVQIAWMRGGKYPDMPFNQQMSFPCDMTLRSTPAGLRIYRNPAAELAKLQGEPRVWTEPALATGAALPLGIPGNLFRIKAQVNIPADAELTLHAYGAKVTLTENAVACNSVPASVTGALKTVEILVDRTSIETFANGGEVSVSTCYLPTDDRLAFDCTKGSPTIHSLTVWPLRSIWPDSK